MRLKPYPFFLYFLLFIVSCEVDQESPTPQKNIDTIVTVKKDQPVKKDSNTLILVEKFKPEPKVSEKIVVDTSKKYIYLTFDDGPQHGTVACFDLCKKLKVKSTFFMVGMHASSENLRNIVKEINDNYPETLLANHSSNHANNKYKSFYTHDSLAVEDLFLAQKVLKVPFNIIRLPGSNTWLIEHRMRPEPLATKLCKRMDTTGYNIIGWDMEWHFNPITANPVQTADQMIEYVKERFERNNLYTSNHLVLLMHDRMFRNQNYTDSLHKFITTLQRDTNYVFETVDHYPGLKPLH